MRQVEFRKRFDDNNAARVRFALERKRVLSFVVQLECRFESEWHPVVRYDTAHGFAHRDMLRPGKETEKTALSFQEYGAALTFAINDLAQNWERYRLRYEKWLKEKRERRT